MIGTLSSVCTEVSVKAFHKNMFIFLNVREEQDFTVKLASGPA